jgi:hypothetical protein
MILGRLAVGYSNVAMAYTYWAFLPDRAFRILGFMALMAADTDNPPCYFAGYAPLARALGRDVPDDVHAPSGDPAQDRARKAALEAVRVNLKPLYEYGVARVLVGPAPLRPPVIGLFLARPDGVRGTPVGVWQHLPTPQAQPADTPGPAWIDPKRSRGVGG